MEIQCECGQFQAQLTKFPKETPGRLKCYCDDCQSFLHYLNRTDLLDANGGSEIIPVYPADFKILKGKDNLKCTRVVANGMFRYSTTCCNTPIANTDDKRPWVGVHRRMFTAKDANKLNQVFDKIGASILGKYGHGTLPEGTPQKFSLKGFALVMPFILKGVALGRKRPSPFFNGTESVVKPYILSEEERKKTLAAASRV